MAVKPSAAVYLAVLATALLLPFAAIPPLIATPWLSLTEDKLLLLLLVVAWLALGRRAAPTHYEWRTLLPTLVFIAIAVVSAALGPADYAGEALRYITRLAACALVLLIALRTGDARPVLWAVAIGGGLSGLLGIGEALHIGALQPVLALFKVAPTRVGGELRVSASFQYATIASMYFEMVTPLAIVLAATSRRFGLQLLGAAIAVVCTANVVLSLTRAGMLTLFAVYGVLLALAIARQNRRRVLLPSLSGTAALVAGGALLLVHDPVFDLRLVSESDADWYGAVYQAPASLTVQPNQPVSVGLDVRNEGRITWTTSETHPFALGYRWLTDDGDSVLDIPPAEVQLSHDVQPGETIHLEAVLRVPDLPAGSYRLDWGMLQRDVLQFYERGWSDAETRVVVQGSATSGTLPLEITPRDDGEAPWVVGRLDLWGAAIRLIAAHPLLGLGPDNFRHFYGAELGLEGWDERVQANNLYLEILADLGILGLAAFLWLVAEPLYALWRSLRADSVVRYDTSEGGVSTHEVNLPSGGLIRIGVALAIGAFLVHGMLDSFLAFTPTALLFWLLLGVAQKPQVSGR
jgi:O-antigen ligase/polysaccharide polymerase Wzy-like membrane protein